MSNLNDFKSDSTLTHIRSLSVGNAVSRTTAGYDEAEQQFTLHADTKVLRIKRTTGGSFGLSYTLDGSTPTVTPSAGAWNGTGSPTFSKYISKTRDTDSGYVSLKVNGGETFKYEYCATDGRANAGGETMIFEEWKY